MVINCLLPSSVVEMTECVIKLYKHFRIPTHLTTTKLSLYLTISSIVMSCYYKKDVNNKTVIMKKSGKLMDDISNLPLIHKESITNSNLLSKHLKFKDVAVIDISKIHLENTWISMTNPVDILMYAIVKWFSDYNSAELAMMINDISDVLSDYVDSNYWVIDIKKLIDMRVDHFYKDNKIIQFINSLRSMEEIHNG